MRTKAPQTWYRAGTTTNITTVQVTRETAYTLHVISKWRGKPVPAIIKKHTKHRTYFPTWAEAHEHLVSQAQADIDSHTKGLAAANRMMKKLQALTENDACEEDPDSE